MSGEELDANPLPTLADLRAVADLLGYNPCKHCGAAPDDWSVHCGHAGIHIGDEHTHGLRQRVATHSYRGYVVADLLDNEPYHPIQNVRSDAAKGNTAP